MLTIRRVASNSFINLLKRKILSNDLYRVYPVPTYFCTSGNHLKDPSSIDLSYSIFKPDETLSSVPLIILHAFLDSKQNWASLGKAIATKSGRHVYILDARNHGDSPHTDEFNIALMCEDVKYFMHTNNINEAVILGHSMGGRTAINFTLLYKELVKKLVVVDISPNSWPIDSSIFPTFMKLMESAAPRALGLSLNEARKAVDEYLSKEIPQTLVRNFLLTNMTERDKKVVWKPNLGGLLRTFESFIVDMPTTSGFYTGETLFICGEKSSFVRPKDLPKIKSLFPKAKIERIAGAGHWIHIEKPSEFVKTLCNFL